MAFTATLRATGSCWTDLNTFPIVTSSVALKRTGYKGYKSLGLAVTVRTEHIDINRVRTAGIDCDWRNSCRYVRYPDTPSKEKAWQSQRGASNDVVRDT